MPSEISQESKEKKRLRETQDSLNHFCIKHAVEYKEDVFYSICDYKKVIGLVMKYKHQVILVKMFIKENKE
jgi:hypothetical protein